MTTAIKLAQDLAAAWEWRAPSDARSSSRRFFETVKVGGGRIVSVKPKAAMMPLIVVTMTEAEAKTGGPDRGLTRNGEVRIHGVVVEQIEDLLDLARGVA